MTRHALPYRTPAPSAVSTGAWLWVLEGQTLDLPDAIEDWDYRMNLALRRSLTVDLDAVNTDTGLPVDSRYVVTVVWTATGSGLKSAAQHVSLVGTGERRVSLDIDLPGTQLGGVLTLDTSLALAEASDSGGASPRRAGSVLWTDRCTIRLQGDAPQFPIAIVDFSKTQFPHSAGWYTQISGDLGTATMGALLLLINERKRAVVEAFENAAKPRPIDQVLLSAVYADVARTMIEHALRETDFALEADYPEESMGANLQGLIGSLFPAMSLDHLCRRLEQTPSLFATELQDAVRIFEDLR
jgi:hypothetical protein